MELFTRFISNARGKLIGRHLSRIFKGEYKKEIVFKNDIEVVSLSEYIQKNLELGDTIITRLTSLYGSASINIDGNEAIIVDCPSCISPGERNIKIKVNAKTIWLSAKVKIKKSGFVLKKDVTPFNTELTEEMIEEATAFDDGKEMLFRDAKNIRFYRPSRPLSKGKTLSIRDLVPRTLVRFNQNVDVLIKGDSLMLKTKAHARQSGKYGDTIKLYNPKTKKNLLGKVIDHNKVVVEL